jgi:hypothetical protein
MNHNSLLLRSSKIVLFTLFVVVAVPLHAAVAIVRSDEAMIRMAPAIITGTVVETYTRHDDRGDIETVTRILVDETIKGSVPPGEIADVVQFGGSLDGRFMAQSGAPAYDVGARYLVVLDRNGRGNWTTFDLALGQFRFAIRDGRPLLLRDTSEVTGWTATGEPFHDIERSESWFLAFVRDVARTPVASSELHAAPLTLDYDLKSVTQTAVGKWFGGAAAMNDSVSASAASADTKDLTDGQSRMIADDPHGDVPGVFNGSGVVATAFFGCTSCAPSSKNSESYISIDQCDVVVNDGVSSSTLASGNFTSAIVHEIGHTWGFRHSNQDAGGGGCALPLPCTSSAIMNSSIVNGLNGTLQSYDQDAANEVYGDGSRQAGNTGTQYVLTLGGTPARRPATTSWRIWQNAVSCTNVGIGTQPQNVSISSGNSTTLSVVATGTGPFTYQWYVGASGNTSSPVGTNSASFTTPVLSSTTSYWVRVSNSCPSSVDSATATVTVTSGGCTNAGIGTQPQSVSINSGSSTTLSVVATGTAPFTYQWYVGASGNTSNPVPSATNASVQVSPISTTSYWVQVSNSCPSSVNSSAATVTVTTGCTPVQIVDQPQSSSVLSGGTAQLSVGAFGSSPITITWYKGTPPDQSNVIGTGPSVTTPPITTATQFYAIVKNCGGSGVATNVVTISVTQTCTAPSISSISATPNTTAGGTPVSLAVNASGSSLTYQWYKGASGNTSTPVSGGTSATINDSPVATTSYWVRVSSGCGAAAADSQAVTVTVSAACIGPSILQPPDIDILAGSTATLHVATTAGTEPFIYQWYQGAKFDTRFPFGTTATITTPPLTADTPFFVNVSNACGNVNTETITVHVKLKRRQTVIHR